MVYTLTIEMILRYIDIGSFNEKVEKFQQTEKN